MKKLGEICLGLCGNVVEEGFLIGVCLGVDFVFVFVVSGRSGEGVGFSVGV